MWVIFHRTIIAKPEIVFVEEFSQGICSFEQFNFIVAWGVDPFIFACAGYTTEPAESHVWTKLDAMDSIVLSTCDGCWIIKLLCHVHSLPAFSTPTICLWTIVLVGSEVQMRSGCWGSNGHSLVVSSGGCAPSPFSMSCSLIDCLSMSIQVHLLWSNKDRWACWNPPGDRNQLGIRPSSIDIGLYCWYWASSRLSLHNSCMHIMHLTWFQWELIIFEKCSALWQMSVIHQGIRFVAGFESPW